MKKLLKMGGFILIFALLITSVAFASTTEAKDDGGEQELSEIRTIIGRILNVIAWIGYAISLGMIMIIGMKYMMSAANERAELKKGLVNYVIGVFIIVSASAIANIVSSIAMNSSSGQGSSDPAQRIIDTGVELGGLGGSTKK